jgi:flagellar hook protein FlgE
MTAARHAERLRIGGNSAFLEISRRRREVQGAAVTRSFERNELDPTAGTTAAATSQNGYGAGTLSNVTIDQSGIVIGVFTNGQVLQIAQLAIASFADPEGLTREGDNYFSLSSESGPPLIGAGKTGGRGSVQQGQLEDSNVDVALEFTKLIIAQRGFEPNAHSITAGDQVLQDLVNIIH